MHEHVDVAIVGAGPAGMAAAHRVAAAGLSCVLLDDQPAPGGQVWRGVEMVAARGDLRLFGSDYRKGVQAVRDFRAAGVDYRPESRVFGVEDRDGGGDVLYLRDAAARRLVARKLIVAVGAYERPTPFPGWTLPGVMSIGAGQIVLKVANAAPEGPFVLAGQGPLLLLYAAQLRRAGRRPDRVLLLDDPANRWRALSDAVGAFTSRPLDVAKGLAWRARLGRVVTDVVEVSAEGGERLERVSWRRADGSGDSMSAAVLLAHDGVLPNAQLTRAMRAPHRFHARTQEWRPEADPSTGALAGRDWVYVAGDCRGIGGWRAAQAAGALTGQAVASSLGHTVADRATERDLATALAARPLLDALYPPARAFAHPADATLVCRCEEVTAGEVRAAAGLGAQGPNQLKAFTRAGMGPCQGRMCGQTVSHILATAQHRDQADVGLARLRMPISPVTVGEMAALADDEMHLPTV